MCIRKLGAECAILFFGFSNVDLSFIDPASANQSGTDIGAEICVRRTVAQFLHGVDVTRQCRSPLKKRKGYRLEFRANIQNRTLRGFEWIGLPPTAIRLAARQSSGEYRSDKFAVGNENENQVVHGKIATAPCTLL